MEQDEVGLDAQVAELLDALLEVAEVGGVGSLEVPAGLRRALEGIAGRLVRAVDRVLRQYPHEMTFTYTEPGTYLPVLRATAQREADTATPFAQVGNIGRARVVVR